MKTLKNNLSRLLPLVFSTVIAIACKDGDITPVNNLDLVTVSGVSFNPDGLWESGCATDTDLGIIL